MIAVSNEQRAMSNECKGFYSLLIAFNSLLNSESTINNATKENQGGCLWQQ